MQFDSLLLARRTLGAAWRWPNFSVAELACRCGGRFCGGSYWHDAAFLDRLQALRDAIGKPLHLSSAHRCPLWNAAIGGAPQSQHKRIAVDILTDGHDRRALRAAATSCGFTGFGFARTFLHLDCRAQPAFWFYKRSEALWQT